MVIQLIHFQQLAATLVFLLFLMVFFNSFDPFQTLNTLHIFIDEEFLQYFLEDSLIFI